MSDENKHKNFNEAAGSLQDKASKTFEDARTSIQDTAEKMSDSAKQKGHERISSAKDDLAGEGKRLARGLRGAADAQRENSVQSRVLDIVADSLRDASEGLQGRSIDTIYADVENFARRNPAVFIAGAALAGFAAARFARASAPTGSSSSNFSSTPTASRQGQYASPAMHETKDDTAGEAFKGAAP